MSKKKLICLGCEKPSEKCSCDEEKPIPLPITETHEPEYVIREALRLLRSSLPLKPTAKQLSDRFGAIADAIEVLYAQN